MASTMLVILIVVFLIGKSMYDTYEASGLTSEIFKENITSTNVAHDKTQRAPVLKAMLVSLPHAVYWPFMMLCAHLFEERLVASEALMCCRKKKRVKDETAKTAEGNQNLETSIDQKNEAQIVGKRRANKNTRFREMLLRSRDDQKTIAIGTIAQIIPTDTAQSSKKSKKNESKKQNMDAKMKENRKTTTPTTKTARSIPSKKHAKAAKKNVDDRNPKTSDTQGNSSVHGCNEQANTKKRSATPRNVSPAIDMVTTTPLMTPSVDTGGALVSLHAEPEIFENLPSQRLQTQDGNKSRLSSNERKSMLMSVQKTEALFGYQDNISDENEEEKLYNVHGPMTASALVSRQPNGKTGGKRSDSRTKQMAVRRKTHEDDTLEDVPEDMPDEDYDVPAVATKSTTPKKDITKTSEKKDPAKFKSKKSLITSEKETAKIRTFDETSNADKSVLKTQKSVMREASGKEEETASSEINNKKTKG
ncbi:hypothetical protein Ddc_01678 [Ditylenchus destructor]|nr:hypothetical protein Ddc_01678 [Ditylenchus destructor]